VPISNVRHFSILIEIKANDDSLSTNFKIFEKFLPGAEKIQLVDGIKKRNIS